MSDTLPPLPHQEWLGYDPEQGNLHGYSADQMREYAAEALAAERERQHEQMRQLMSELLFDEPAAVAEPVASVTECEACFTPDVCQLRGTCDHYAAERLRVAAPPQREPYDQTALGLCNACGWKAVGPDGCLNCAPQREPLPPVEGDVLPSIGSKVLIHLARQDQWVEHTVVGYYVWPNHGLVQSVFRVFVRVMDSDGYLNARCLQDVRYPGGDSIAPASAPKEQA